MTVSFFLNNYKFKNEFLTCCIYTYDKKEIDSSPEEVAELFFSMIGKNKEEFLTTKELEDIFIQNDITDTEIQKENLIVIHFSNF